MPDYLAILTNEMLNDVCEEDLEEIDLALVELEILEGEGY